MQYNSIRKKDKGSNPPHVTKLKKTKLTIKDYNNLKIELHLKMNSNYINCMITKLENIKIQKDKIGLNNIVKNISDTYINSAKQIYNENKKKAPKNRKKQKVWYTYDCKTLKRKLNQIRKSVDKNPVKKETRKLFYKTQK